MPLAVLAPIQGAADSVSAEAHGSPMSECEALFMVLPWTWANRSIAPPWGDAKTPFHDARQDASSRTCVRTWINKSKCPQRKDLSKKLIYELSKNFDSFKNRY